jgi:hypothetical protein
VSRSHPSPDGLAHTGLGVIDTVLSFVTVPASTVVQTIYAPSTILATSTTVISGVPTTVVVTQTQIALQTQTVTLPPRVGELSFPSLARSVLMLSCLQKRSSRRSQPRSSLSPYRLQDLQVPLSRRLPKCPQRQPRHPHRSS